MAMFLMIYFFIGLFLIGFEMPSAAKSMVAKYGEQYKTTIVFCSVVVAFLLAAFWPLFLGAQLARKINLNSENGGAS